MHPQDDQSRNYYENKKFIKQLSEWISFDLTIADDDEDDLDLFEKAFSEIAPGFHINKAHGSDDLMKKLAEATTLPDLVILDLNVPAKNGFEILKEIRFHQKLSQLPVMVYSTTANEEQVAKTYELGANMYIQKPNNFQGIKILIEKIIHLDPACYVPQAERSEFLYKIG